MTDIDDIGDARMGYFPRGNNYPGFMHGTRLL
jgi:hypothetical protein